MVYVIKKPKWILLSRHYAKNLLSRVYHFFFLNHVWLHVLKNCIQLFPHTAPSGNADFRTLWHVNKWLHSLITFGLGALSAPQSWSSNHSMMFSYDFLGRLLWEPVKGCCLWEYKHRHIYCLPSVLSRQYTLSNRNGGWFIYLLLWVGLRVCGECEKFRYSLPPPFVAGNPFGNSRHHGVQCWCLFFVAIVYWFKVTRRQFPLFSLFLIKKQIWFNQEFQFISLIFFFFRTY